MSNDSGTLPIICMRCGAAPALVSLAKNDGTVVECRCDDRLSLDSVPYEYSTHDFPDRWEIVEPDESEPTIDPNQTRL